MQDWFQLSIWPETGYEKQPGHFNITIFYQFIQKTTVFEKFKVFYKVQDRFMRNRSTTVVILKLTDGF